MGIYQMRFLERIPAHAAINESVNLVRQFKVASAASFVNAVLRNAQRELKKTVTELIPQAAGKLQRIAIETSHPEWLIERWLSRFGEEETRALALANNEVPRVALRFNLRQAPEETIRAWFGENGISINDSTIVPRACVVEAGALSPSSKPIQQGWVYPQDECSQLVAHLAVDSAAHEASAFRSILDLCAAPGSKTTLMESLLGDSGGGVIACDIHHHRLRTLGRLARVAGAGRLLPVQLNATLSLPFAPSSFDSVLVDAPCSGLGTLQRHPEIKWRVNEVNIRELAELQQQILENATTVLRPGGLLTYSVCSTEPEEGEDVIGQFKRGHPEFRDVTRERLVESGLDATRLLTSSHGARSFCHRNGCESFFFCVLWKRK
jgi:16S rRNA (cytosine967-C5)-methyltransferase